MRKKILAFLAVILLMASYVPTTVFAAGSTTVSTADALITALADGYTDITVSGGSTLTSGSTVTIPSGTTVTFASGGYYITLSCAIINNGAIINNNDNLGCNSTINNSGSLVNNGKFYNNSTGTITNTGTINNIGTLSNAGTINNNGTITSSGTWTDTGTYTGSAIVADNPVEVINGSGDVTYYTTFTAAVAVINNTGYELRILKDITIDGNATLPIVPFTLTGVQAGGGTSTLTVNNGNFAPNANVILQNINLAHTGTGGSFNTYYQSTVGGVIKYYKADLTVQSGVTFSDIDIVGKSGTLNSSGAAQGSTLNIQGNVDLGSNSVTDIESINISNGKTFTIDSLQTKNLSLSDGSTLDITGTGGLSVTGALSSSGSDSNILSLPAPSDHSGTVYSAMLTNTTITATNAIKVQPASGATFTNKCKLIYLNNTTAGTNDFVSGDSKFTVATRTLDGNQYLTVINATNTTLTCAETPITYGADSFTLTAAVKDTASAAVTSGTVKFYKGSSDSGSLLATVNLDGSGNAQTTVSAKDYATVGDNEFYALYEDSSDDYSQSNGTATVHMNAKTLTVSTVSISDKAYDGTTAATITAINLSGIVGTDNVSASATAAFKTSDVEENKAVDLSVIHLSGMDAGNYTIAGTAADIATTAKITKADPAVQLSASPASSAALGDTITLTASAIGAASGTEPSGTVTFYNGSTVLGTEACTAGQATYTWSGETVGTYSLSAKYSGDTNYNEATSAAMNYSIIKNSQAALTVSEVPSEIHYGDAAFTLTATGGSGSGAISYAVKSGTSVNVDASTGVVTIVRAGESTITVTKAGTDTYEPISTDVTVNVSVKTLTVSSVSISDKAYDGTTAATITAINLSGIAGTDNVSASAVAAFKTSDAAENKVVDLSAIQLSGTDAGNYTIAGTAADIATTAKITKADPTAQLSASPAASAALGDTITLTASVTGAASGTEPSGTVTFYNESTVLGTAACTAGQATYTWNSAAVGTYSLSAGYGGDTNYNEVSSAVMNYSVSKISQTALTVSGTPSEVHYGDAAFTLTATGGSGSGAISYAVKSGTSVNLDASTGVVTVVGAGESTVTVTKAGTDTYEPVSTDVTVNVLAKALTVSTVSISDKAYDGTTAATITAINLSGIVGTDNVTASATAAFKTSDVGENKTVDLSAIQLSGTDAGNYKIAGTAADITTTAKITKAESAVQLSASPAASAALGDTITLTASVAGAASGTAPSGTVTFYNGSNVLGTAACTAGQATYTWSSAVAGTYSLSAKYSGDANYDEAISAAMNYSVSKNSQAVLTVSGVPSEIHYGDAAFKLTATGGSGSGAISYAVKSGTSVNVDASTGVVTIVGAGESMITVTKAGSETYASISTDVPINVLAIVPGIPVGVSATAGDEQAVISFTVPSDNGGSAITAYVVTASPGGISVTGMSSPVTVTGLTNGITYTFTVKAVNGAGTGLNSSDSNAVTPYASSSGDRSSGTAASTTQHYQAVVSADGATSETVAVSVDTGAGKATVDVPSKQVDSLKGGGAAVITMPTIPNVSNYTVGIPVADLSANDGTGKLTVNSEEGSITVSANMLSGTAGANGSEAEITIGQGDISALTENVKAAIGDRPLVQLTLTVDGERIEWNNPDAPVSVSIPYTPTAAELSNPESIVVWYIDGSGKAVSVPNGHYNPATGTVTFYTTHFSDYAIGFNKVNFNDMEASQWYDEAVNFIAARGIAAGSGNGNYNPNAKLTRGEFIVMLMRAYGIEPDDNPSDNFADAGNAYYTEYLAKTKRLGISDGIGGNLFAPNKEISRQEMFTLLYNALKELKQLPENISVKQLTNFSDASQIDSWAKDAMELLVENGTIDGDDGKLSPKGTTTRAQMAQVIYNLLAK